MYGISCKGKSQLFHAFYKKNAMDESTRRSYWWVKMQDFISVVGQFGVGAMTLQVPKDGSGVYI